MVIRGAASVPLFVEASRLRRRRRQAAPADALQTLSVGKVTLRVSTIYIDTSTVCKAKSKAAS